MGLLDQLAKQTFAEETAGVTRGAMSWDMPPELGLSDVRLDGMLLVRDPALVHALPPPWREARGHDQICLEAKMPGDHLGLKALERALLRRQAWQVQRVEGKKPPWRGQLPLWMVAPRVPATLRAVRRVTGIAPGCHEIDTGSFSFLWIAANDLPLREELIPFLVARSGRALDAFARWVATRRPAAWVTRMLQAVPMSESIREEILRWIPGPDEPSIIAQQRHMTKVLLDIHRDLREEVVAEGHRKGVEEGSERTLSHLAERRLARPLTDDEHHTLRDRVTKLGAERLGDVVLDLAPEALAAWLANPDAT